MKISAVIQLIQAKMNAKSVADDTVDQIIIGDGEQEVSGIVTTFMATIEVIQQAIAIGANLIITHEPTWYNAHDEEAWIENDRLYKIKKTLIEQGKLVIWRCHDAMHRTKPDIIYHGFDTVLGWHDFHLEPLQDSENPLSRADLCYQIPTQKLSDLIETLHTLLPMEVIRYIGNMNQSVHRVGVLLGGSSLGLGDEKNPMHLIHERNLDVVICGDIVEWTLPAYVRDAVMIKQNLSMIIIGHERSEEVGMEVFVAWLKQHIQNIEISFISAEEPFQYSCHDKQESK